MSEVCAADDKASFFVNYKVMSYLSVVIQNYNQNGRYHLM